MMELKDVIRSLDKRAKATYYCEDDIVSALGYLSQFRGEHDTSDSPARWEYEDRTTPLYRCTNCKKFIPAFQGRDEKFEDLKRTDAYRYCPRCGKEMSTDSRGEDS